jgi:hypothetical protein
MLEVTRLHDSTASAHTLSVAITTVHIRIIRLLTARGQSRERYAALRNRARTQAARDLIARIRDDVQELEQTQAKRIYKRRAVSGAKFVGAIERFVGDLLRVRAGTTGMANIHRALGSSRFADDNVKYDMFTKVLDGLKTLGLVGHQKGQSRYRKTPFGNASEPGHAARFWATSKLLGLAAHYGIHDGNVGDHFAPEPPKNPLVLKDYAIGKGKDRESGRRIKYKNTSLDTPEAKRLEADVRELNDFLLRFEILGGEHYGYERVFNNLSWKKGGRLYSSGEDCYQRLPEADRLKMTINGEPVAEIDIKASFLTVYHAMVKQPLQGSGDPYAALSGFDRSIVKLWTTISFGNSNPATRWPPKAAKDFKKETGKDLGKLAKAKDIAQKMLETFPALEKLENLSEAWAHLQYREGQAVIGTMLTLKREHGIPSLSMYDGIIVPRSKSDLAQSVLKRMFKEVVGVEPILTAETADPRLEASDL